MATIQLHGAPDETMLPALRSELMFSDGPLDAKGFPTLIVTDPTRGAYFRLEWPASAIVQGWRSGPAAQLIEHLATTFGLKLSQRALVGVLDFLGKNELLRLESPGQWQALANRNAEARNRAPFQRLIHAYLFFRLPLINPDRQLTRAVAWLEHRLTLTFWLVYAALVLTGAYLTVRQWDLFLAGAHDLMRLDALPVYAALLLGLKLVHECGHALMARRFNCHIPSMGIAVMMGVPVFYTDTTDTWRLPEWHKRALVAMAGVGAEFLVAGLALLMWSLVEDATLRQMCIALVTLSFITSLAINLNPLMRFDGYFALSDFLGIANLQERGFRQARNHIRSLVFGLPQPVEADLSAGQARFLVIYGYMTAIYRLMLYIGIAAMVYATSFKLLGLALMGLVAVMFILRPIWREAKDLWGERAAIRSAPRGKVTGLVLVALVLLVVLPLNRIVEAPAFLVAREEAALHAHLPGRLAAIHVQQGDRVEAGTQLFVLESPALTAETVRLAAERTALEARLTRAAAYDAERDALAVIQGQLRAVIERQNAVDRQKRDLVVRSPISGVIVDMDPMLIPGLWLKAEAPLARIAALEGAAVHAFVPALEGARLERHATAAFIAEAGMAAPVALRIADIASTGDALRLEPSLAETHGGPVPVATDSKALNARRGMVHVLLVAEGGAPAIAQRGTVRMTASAESLAWRAVRTALGVFTRESGF